MGRLFCATAKPTETVLSETEQRGLVSSFGPIVSGLDSFYLSNEKASGRGELVPHSDHCFFDHPLQGLALYAKEASETGGATLFVNAGAACQALPDDLRAELAEKEALHIYDPSERLGEGYEGPDVPEGGYRAIHPVIWDHPVTGVPILYVNPWMTRAIVGMDADAGRALLSRVFHHLENPEFSYRHEWRRNDFVVWDNMMLLHAREDYDPSQPRVMHRLEIGLAGSSPNPHAFAQSSV